MCNTEKAHAIVEKYRLKVKRALYRKRGNPMNVITAMKYLRGMHEQTWCENCSTVGPVQLHHKDGVWRNYTVENLIFVCKSCHLKHHGELVMRNIVNWAPIVDTLITFVDNQVSNGNTKATAFREFTSLMNANKIKGYTPRKKVNYLNVENAYYNYVSRKNSGKSKIQNTPSSPPRIVCNTEMTLDEAVSFYNTMVAWGITIVKS